MYLLFFLRAERDRDILVTDPAIGSVPGLRGVSILII